MAISHSVVVAGLVQSLFEFESPNALDQVAFVHAVVRKFEPVRCMTLAALRMMHVAVDDISSHIGKQLERAQLMDSLEPPILYLLQLNSVFPKERLFLAFTEQLNSEKGEHVGIMMLLDCEKYVMNFLWEDVSRDRPTRRQLLAASYLLGVLAESYGTSISLNFLLFELLERLFKYPVTEQQSNNIDLLEIICVLLLSWPDAKFALEINREDEDLVRRVIVWSSRLAFRNYLALTPLNATNRDSENLLALSAESAGPLIEFRLGILNSIAASCTPVGMCKELLEKICLADSVSDSYSSSVTQIDLPEEVLARAK